MLDKEITLLQKRHVLWASERPAQYESCVAVSWSIMAFQDGLVDPVIPI